MSETNKFGLSRAIPEAVKRDVRRRSRFGCVVCRCGLAQYEHIEPTFADARSHDAFAICLLCASCHDRVTRGHLSKSAVAAAYSRVSASGADEIGRPIGPLDFHDGRAELAIGNLIYSPAVKTILRYHGVDLMRVDPGANDEPGSISAVFTDEHGQESMRLDRNIWSGNTQAWDIEVTGATLVVRARQGRIALQLRLEAPGRVVIERLDMRYETAHLLVGPKWYAVGRCFLDGIAWMHVSLEVVESSGDGVAIEFVGRGEVELRDREATGPRCRMATADGDLVIDAFNGVMWGLTGIVIGARTGSFKVARVITGAPTIEEMRDAVLHDPDVFGELCKNYVRRIKTARIE